MTTVTNEQALWKVFESGQTDLLTASALADYCEEQGDLLTAYAVRWMQRNGKRVISSGGDYEHKWGWFDHSFYGSTTPEGMADELPKSLFVRLKAEKTPGSNGCFRQYKTCRDAVTDLGLALDGWEEE